MDLVCLTPSLTSRLYDFTRPSNVTIVVRVLQEAWGISDEARTMVGRSQDLNTEADGLRVELDEAERRLEDFESDAQAGDIATEVCHRQGEGGRWEHRLATSLRRYLMADAGRSGSLLCKIYARIEVENMKI